MAAKDEVVRKLAATVASNEYRAHPDRRRVRQRAGQAPDHLRAIYEAEVDPDSTLDSETRRRRADAAWRRDEARRLLDEHRAGLGDHDGGSAA